MLVCRVASAVSSPTLCGQTRSTSTHTECFFGLHTLAAHPAAHTTWVFGHHTPSAHSAAHTGRRFGSHTPASGAFLRLPSRNAAIGSIGCRVTYRRVDNCWWHLPAQTALPRRSTRCSPVCGMQTPTSRLGPPPGRGQTPQRKRTTQTPRPRSPPPGTPGPASCRRHGTCPARAHNRRTLHPQRGPGRTRQRRAAAGPGGRRGSLRGV